MTLLAQMGCAITLFINIVVPLLACRSLWRRGFRAVRWWRVLALSFVISSVGISLGYHRFFSHRSFQTSAGGKWLLATIGQLSLQGTPLYWAAQHRLHHTHCEEELDPHSPAHGFWHAHGGWLTGLTGPTVDTNPGWSMRLVEDLALDSDLRGLVHGPLATAHPVVVSLGLPLASLLLFGGHATLWYLHVPQALAWHATLSVNSATHTFGYPRRSAVDDPSGGRIGLLIAEGPCRARNVPWLFGLLLGEAWHANHHARPGRTSMEGDWWEVDPQFRLLQLAEAAGLVWGLEGGSAPHGHMARAESMLLQMATLPLAALAATACCWRRVRLPSKEE